MNPTLFMDIARYRSAVFFIASTVVIIAAVGIFAFGLRLGIDFTGGSILEVRYGEQAPSVADIRSRLDALGVPSPAVQSAEDGRIIIRAGEIGEDRHRAILSALGEEAEELRFESIGPVIGKELRSKTVLLIFFSLLAIVGYIAMAFRRAPERVRPWQYSLASLAALLHDLLAMLGLFAFLGWKSGVHINIPTVIAFLTVLGYSINNTVVVFDRMRENILRHPVLGLQETVNRSIRETFGRSVNTSLTTLIVLVALFLTGGETLRDFSLALIAGIVAGTFSSVLLAPLLLLRWNEKRGIDK